MARLLAGTFLLAATAGMAQAETRALSLYNTHTQERATVVFKRDGSYDSAGLQELNRLLRDWRRNEVTRMDPMLFDLVWDVYRRVGSHQPIHIVSGYRSPATNNALRNRSRGVAKFSQHMLGKAMDFYLPDVPLSTLRETGMKLQMGGVGFYPTSGSPFVHMDTGSVRAWPRMTREQLARLFPDGKTAHLPADGSPLPGYQEALAEVQSRKERGGGPVESSSSGGGLLAALFGGGSSSSSSYNHAAAPGDDEEEAPAPAPRRAQELRQGPLPPGSDPKVLARKGEPPPGVDQTRLAAAPPPAPVPLPPVQTATAGGSLVPLPVAAPSAGPTRPTTVASVEPMPSRYGPSAGGLPPGWVQGPSGRPVAEAERPQQIAFTPGLKPMAAPLPADRPGRAPTEMLALAALPAEASGFVLPKPRPRGAAHLAEAAIPGDAHAALSAFTGETDAEVALGYASAAPRAAQPVAEPGPTMRLASLAPTQNPTAPRAPESRFSANAPFGGKADRIAAAPRKGRSDRVGVDRLFDAAIEIEDDGQSLRHPDQTALDPLFEKPRMTVATGFVTAALDAELGAHAFTGPAVISLPVILTK
ncbi:MAG: DUF882 domain-containing protein [Hyphomicrobiales bacterium]|nr:DUF882 domain-containing protein [Hyphomicrobiales bacterium]